MEKPPMLEEYLVPALYSHQKSNKPNTWEWVRAQRKLLATDTENYPYRESVEDMWAHMESYYLMCGCSSLVERDADELSGENPVMALLYFDEMGFYPPPELLTTIVDAFKIYLISGGRLSLEEAMFGPAKKGVGNFAARKWKKKNYARFEIFITFTRASKNREGKPKVNLEELAEEYIKNTYEMNTFDKDNLNSEYEEEDVDSFLRGFRRWKKKSSDE